MATLVPAIGASACDSTGQTLRLQVVNVLQRNPQLVHEGGPPKGKLAFPWGYGVVFTRITRNRDRFPSDFLFHLTTDEKTEVVVNCDHLQNLKFSTALPLRLLSTEPPKRPTRPAR
jgi:hypothetical protein